MREDMAKVIVERPRWGGGARFPRGAGRDGSDLENLPPRQPIKRPWMARGLEKGLNENLAPLRRYLLSNVGRPWDKVFGEICERINFDSAVQLHIWQHVKQYVCLDAVRTPGGYADSRGLLAVWPPFVVDSKTGLLRKNDASRWWRRWKWRRERQPADSNLVRIDDTHSCRRINGIWYEVELRPVPRDLSFVFDAVARKPVAEIPPHDLERVGGVPHYAAVKRQLNSREVRRLQD